MITDRINEMCKIRGTNMTALCKEVTGSSGNTATWNKDRVRSDWLRKICRILDVSSDYLLELSNDAKIHEEQSSSTLHVINYPDNEWMEKINILPNDLQCELRGYLNRLLEEAQTRKQI